MCGLVGFSRISGVDVEQLAQRMNSTMFSRGPDAGTVWNEKNQPIILAHRRLSILDLSPAGGQPMNSKCGRYVIAYNGEIYNHLELRNLLVSQGKFFPWTGRSDTETLLACFSSWGTKKTLTSLVGMFAIALWDKQEKKLTLARDRFGEKPLYWGWNRSTLMFASELKALRPHPHFCAEIDRNSLALLLKYSYIPSPNSIYKGIEKLAPGHFVEIPFHGDIELSKKSKPESYWSLAAVARNGLRHPFNGNETEAIDLMERHLMHSVAGQSIADVPLGAFLSGGVDSSTIVALMQAQSDRPVHTYSIGFNNESYNEARYAAAVAQHLMTDHTEMYVTDKDALEVIPRLPSIYCEPFADSSQIPTYLVSQLARQQVKVALSGDGGDELFGGYTRYLIFARIEKILRYLPSYGRKPLSIVLNSLSSSQWNGIFRILSPVLPRRLQIPHPGNKIKSIAAILPLSNSLDIYQSLISTLDNSSNTIIRENSAEHTQLDYKESLQALTPKYFEDLMMVADAHYYLPDDILTKVDRAAMANSLETRVPMLDHRVAELAWKMPMKYKIRNGQGKWLLRQILYRHVPRELIERPKMGFRIPLGYWLRSSLRDWADELLSEHRLRREGYFYPERIRKMWEDHLSEKNNFQYQLWNILMFQAWLAEQ